MLVALSLVVAGCANRGVHLPRDPGAPLADAAPIHHAVSRQCAGLRTLTVEIALSGRAAGQRLRGRLVAGFGERDAMRIEATAPFGAPVFIIVSTADRSTLLLPRDAAVLEGEPPGAVLEALTGVALAPADLRALLTGCVSLAPLAAGTAHAGGWVTLRFADGSTMFLRRQNGTWVVRAGARAGWRVEYPVWRGTFPSAVRLESGDADLRLDLRQLETNVPIDAAAFTVVVPPGAERVTLADLRRAGTLKESR